MPKSDAAKPEAEETIDPKAAEKAFAEVKQRLAGLDAKRLSALTVDLEKAAMGAAAVGRKVKKKGMREVFASLPKDRFEQAHVNELETLSLAAWHAAVELRSASAGSSQAKLPVALVQEATQIKQRMIKLLSYHYGEHPEVGPELTDIIQGTGYADLASDLVRLAKLYKKYRDEVKLDRKNYVATDEADAGRCAHAIVKALGEEQSNAEKTWTDLVLRIWTLLETSYNEVMGGGLWLFRHENGAALFPSIYVLGRSARVRTAKAPKAGGEGGPEAPPQGMSGPAPAAPRKARRRRK